MLELFRDKAFKYIDKIRKNSDIILAVAVMGIIVIMLIPIPIFLLDILLTLSISISIVILLVSIYAEKPLDFSSFPFVLLITTLFRLSLNVATTRTILLHGASGPDAAGGVIEAFGQFVVGGNFVVGIIVFIILVIINFMVITKGSGRVAEVAARFTLDAMPGKQMAIDADLNAGIIDDKEAKHRRETIRREADFHGSMDGASKFVRGDAVAGLIITAINMVGGLLIGVLQNNMSFMAAGEVFIILTIGDGLVSQVPALIVSTAAGIIVTRAGSDNGSLAKQLAKQLFPQAKILFILGGILSFFAAIPGMPKVPFILLALISFGAGYLMHKEYKQGLDFSDSEDDSENARDIPEDDQVKSLLDMDIMELVVGTDLVPMIDRNSGGILLDKIMSIRKDIAQEMGFIVPPIRIYDDINMRDSRDYSIVIRGVQVAKGSVMPDRYLAINMSGATIDNIDGLDAIDPVFGVPAKWVDEMEKEKAELSGYMVVSAVTAVSVHLSEVIKQSAPDLLGRQETQDLLDRIKLKTPKLIDDLVPTILDIGNITRILQTLLKERVSVRNMPVILETLANYAPNANKNIEYLSEKVRYALRRQICENLLANDGKLYALRFPSVVEQMLLKSIQQSDEGREIVLDPAMADKILTPLITKLTTTYTPSSTAVMIVPQQIRYVTFKFLNLCLNSKILSFSKTPLPKFSIIAFNEVAEDVTLEIESIIDISDNATVDKGSKNVDSVNKNNNDIKDQEQKDNNDQENNEDNSDNKS